MSSVGLIGWAALLGGAALALRLPFMLGEHPVTGATDAPEYLRYAQGVFHGAGFQSLHFYTPGYPVLEAVLDFLPGRQADAIIVVQHLVGVAVVVALVIATGRHFGKTAAIIAGALAALSPVLVVHEHTLVPDFLLGVLLLAGGLTLAEAVGRVPVSWRLLAVTGVLFGLATYLKPVGQILLVAAFPALLYATRSVRRSLAGSAVVGAALLMTISPWLVRNAVRFDLYSMSNQGSETLFYRVFDIDRTPVPSDQRYGEFAAAIQRSIAAEGPGTQRAVTFDFHYGLVQKLGASHDEARSAEGNMARVAIRRHPMRYLEGTVRELGDSVAHINHFDGKDELLAELATSRPAVGGGVTEAIWDAVRPLYSIWWALSLSMAAGLLTLLVGSRRSRNAAAALLSVWFAISLGTALGHGDKWRYSVQLAPIAWMLGSAGVSIVVSGIIAQVRRRGDPAGGRLG